MRIFTDGAEIGDMNDDFWKNLPEPKGKMPTPWSVRFFNQDKISITIERGNVHIETDISHCLFFNRLMEREFIIDFLVRCEHCQHFTPASQFCEHCGALVL